MTPEQQTDAVQAALAEAGYPDCVLEWERVTWFDHPTPGTNVLRVYEGPSLIEAWPVPPRSVYWRACALTYTDDSPSTQPPCWPCIEARRHRECTHDFRVEPWPPVVVPHA